MEKASGQEHPPTKALMDDVTLLKQSIDALGMHEV